MNYLFLLLLNLSLCGFIWWPCSCTDKRAEVDEMLPYTAFISLLNRSAAVLEIGALLLQNTFQFLQKSLSTFFWLVFFKVRGIFFPVPHSEIFIHPNMVSHKLMAIKLSCLNLFLRENKLPTSCLPESQACSQQLIKAVIAAIPRVGPSFHPPLCFFSSQSGIGSALVSTNTRHIRALPFILYLIQWRPAKTLLSHSNFYPNFWYFSPAVHISVCSCLNETTLHLPRWCPSSVLLTSLCHMCSMDVLFLV